MNWSNWPKNKKSKKSLLFIVSCLYCLGIIRKKVKIDEENIEIEKNRIELVAYFKLQSS